MGRLIRVPLLLALASGSDSKARRDFVWFSDIHLDLTYVPDRGQHEFCRDPSIPPDLTYKQLLHVLRNNLQQGTDWLDQLSQQVTESYTTVLAASETNNTLEPAGAMDPYSFELAQRPLLPAFHGRFGCDSPLSLFWSALESAWTYLRREDVRHPTVLITGDFAAHYWKSQQAPLRLMSILTGTKLMERIFKSNLHSGVPFNGSLSVFENLDRIFKTLNTASEISEQPQIIIAVGNNDLARDYRSEVNSTWNALMYEVWKDTIVPKDQEEVFKKGLYYAVDLKAVPGVRAISLNTVWYHKLAPYDPNVEDPADQFTWLGEELKEIKAKGNRAIILGHVAPAQSLFKSVVSGFLVDSQWHDSFVKRFEAILDSYRDIIDGQYFGHLHTDEFRLEMFETKKHSQPLRSKWLSSTGAKPKGLILMAPSISPNHENNPSWRHGVWEVSVRHTEDSDDLFPETSTEATSVSEEADTTSVSEEAGTTSISEEADTTSTSQIALQTSIPARLLQDDDDIRPMPAVEMDLLDDDDIRPMPAVEMDVLDDDLYDLKVVITSDDDDDDEQGKKKKHHHTKHGHTKHKHGKNRRHHLKKEQIATDMAVPAMVVMDEEQVVIRSAFNLNDGHHTASKLVLKSYVQHYARLYGYQHHGKLALGTFDSDELIPFDKHYTSRHVFGSRLRKITPEEVFFALEDHILVSEKSTSKWWNTELAFGGAPPTFLVRCAVVENYVTDNIRRCVQKTIAEAKGRHSEPIDVLKVAAEVEQKELAQIAYVVAQ